jgi:catechol 2,3-dioxygenase-like lactoylglutathione lyase family enzyme
MTATHDHPPTLGLRHVAVSIAGEGFDHCARFYVEGMGMRVDWRPDADNLYLSYGPDNLALHRTNEVDHRVSALDHLGFVTPAADDVRAWYERILALRAHHSLEIVQEPKLHRDGSTSFYFRDPAGNKVQIIHIPSITDHG